MIRVGVRVEEAHRNGLDIQILELSCDLAAPIFIEGRDNITRAVQTLGNLEDSVWRHGARRFDPSVDILPPRDVVPADLEHVLEALGGDEADVGRSMLDHRVGGDRRAVKDAPHG